MLKDNSLRIKRTYTPYTFSFGLMGAGDSASGTLDSDILRFFLSEIDSTGNITYISAGEDNAFYIKSDGSLWGLGTGSFGKLGNNSTAGTTSFVPIGNLTDWSKVYAGTLHTTAIKTNGTLWAWGNNTLGTLGDNTLVNKSSPVQIGTLTNWANAASGSSYTMAVKSDGTLWGWGANELGQLGNSESNNSFINVNETYNWINGDVGSSHTMAINADGTLWGWGANFFGGLGDSSSTTRSSAVQIGTLANWSKVYSNEFHSGAIKTDNTLWVWGRNSFGQLGIGNTTNYSSPVQVGTLSDWESLSFSTNHALAIKTNGTLWAWGNNSQGQLGDEESQYSLVKITDPATNWNKVSSGASHTIAIKSDGTLWAWGTNSQGQLGDITLTAKDSPVQLGTLNTWSEVFAGKEQSFAVSNNGTLWAWGNNNNGQLGDGTRLTRSSPTQIGTLANWSTVSSYNSHTIAIKSDGTLWGWGTNSNGGIGDGTSTSKSSPVQVGTLNNWSVIATGISHSMAVKNDGTLWAWGLNNPNFPLGTNNATSYVSPVQVGTLTNWSKVFCGDFHTIGIKTDNSLWGWGRGTDGQLGQHAVLTYISPLENTTEFSSSYYTAHAVQTNGTLWGWGEGFYGQIGDGSIFSGPRSSPVQIGTLSNWSKVSNGNSHTMAIKTDGTLWGWGFGSSGQVGDGLANFYNSSPVQVGTLSNWKQVSAGGSYTMAVKTDGTLWGWGRNDYNNLGLSSGTQYNSPVQIGTFTDWDYVATTDYGSHQHTLGLKTDGTLWGWGSTLYGGLPFAWGTPHYYISSPIQLGTLNDWSKIYTRGWESLAIKTDGSLWAWGSNGSGTAGNGNALRISSPTQIGSSYDWSKASISPNHALAIKTDGTLWGWGYNSNGSLTNDLPLNTVIYYPTQLGTRNDWSDVHAGHYLSLLKDTSNILYSMGSNQSEQRGIGSDYNNINRSSPIQIGIAKNWSAMSAGNSYTMGIRTNGTMWGWGSGLHYGSGPDSINRSSPVQIGKVTDWSKLSINHFRGAMLSSPVGSGLVYTLGGNTTSLGWSSNKSSPVQIGTLNNWSQVVVHSVGSFALKDDGTLWSWGQNSSGILGNNDIISYDSPVQVGTLSDWLKLSKTKSFLHTVAIKTDGTLWSWGQNFVGQLGHNDTISRSSPTQIGTQTNWYKVSSGNSYSMAIKTDNTLWGWGTNGIGQLGSKDIISRSAPIQVDSRNIFEDVFACASHTISIDNLSRFFITGGNNLGHYLGKTLTKSSPVQIGTLSDWSGVFTKQKTTLGLKTNGTLWGWGDNSVGTIGANSVNILENSPVQIGTLTNWSKVSVGSMAMAIKTDGTLWAWGYNQGLLGTSDAYRFGVGYLQYNDLSEFAVGYGSTHVIRTDGTLWAWGYNQFGILGDNTQINRSSPVQIGTLKNWSKIFASFNYRTHAIKTDGTLWAWGYGQFGSLGTNSTNDQSSPVQIGTLNDWSKVFYNLNGGFAIKTNNTLWSWGYNAYNVLGLPTYFGQFSSPVQVGTDGWSKLSSYENHTMLLKTNNSLWGLGRNNKGQLGINSVIDVSNPTMVGNDSWTDVAVGLDHSVGIKSGGTLWVWGSGDFGSLGNGQDSYNRNKLISESIWSDKFSISMTHGLAVKTDGTLWAWGVNTYGGLGNGNTATSELPIQVGNLSDWESAYSGYYYSLAKKTDGTLWAWGYNGNGQLGLNNVTNYSSPIQLSATGDWNKIFPAYLENSQDLSTHAIKTDGTLWAWGSDSNGYYLGNGSYISRSSPVQIGTFTDWSYIAKGISYTMAIKTDNTLWGWGLGNSGQLGSGGSSYGSPVQIGTLSDWSKVSCGYSYSMAVKTNGTLWGWGFTSTFGLGNNTWFTNYYSPIQIGTDTDWSTVEVASQSSFALKTNGTFWGWGEVQNGVSGNGYEGGYYRSLPVQITTETGYTDLKLTRLVSVLYRSNTLFTSGLSPYNGRTANYSSPIQLGSLSNWSKLYSTGYSVFASKTDNTLWAWGLDQEGMFGTGSINVIYNSPTQIASSINLQNNLSLGRIHLAVKGADNQLYYSGSNQFGQRGLLDTSNFGFPIQIGSDTNWSEVTTRITSTLAIKTNGTLWGWGTNNTVLSDGTNISRSVPLQIGNLSNWTLSDIGGATSFVRNSSGKLYSTSLGMVYGKSSPIQVSNSYDWSQYSVGNTHVIAIKTNGSLWSWGSNSSGELGNFTTRANASPLQIGTLTNWSKVSSGYDHSLAIKTDGTLWSWGNNSIGQLGHFTVMSRSSPVQVGTGSDWSQVSAGWSNTMAIKTNGTMWAWGSNNQGQLGLGGYTSHSSPVQVGTLSNWSQVSMGISYTMAIKTDGTLWGWGLNNLGQLGTNNNTQVLSPVQVGTLSNWSRVESGLSHTIALKSDQTLWIWGANQSSKTLGLLVSRSDPSFVNTNNLYSKISAGHYFNIAIAKNGTIWGWGENNGGQLGLNSTVTRSSPVQIGTLSDWSKISVGDSFTMAIKSNGTLWGWGLQSAFGELGDNSTTTKSSPVQIGTLTDWSELYSGDNTVISIKTDGTLWAWGSNNQGELGINLGSTAHRSSPVQVGTLGDWRKVAIGTNHVLSIKTDGTLWSWGNNAQGELGQNISLSTHRSSPVQVGTLRDWYEISAGGDYSIALKTNGTLWAWGNNSYGQLGLNNTTSHSSPVQVGTLSNWSKIFTGRDGGSNVEAHTLAIKNDGTLWAWGLNTSGQLGLGTASNVSSPVQLGTRVDWFSVAVGRNHTTFLDIPGYLYTAGNTTSGQLGYFTDFQINISSPVQLGYWTKWNKIANNKFSNDSNYAIKTDGTLWSWGQNSGQGLLGDNSIISRSSPVQIGNYDYWDDISAGGSVFVGKTKY